MVRLATASHESKCESSVLDNMEQHGNMEVPALSCLCSMCQDVPSSSR